MKSFFVWQIELTTRCPLRCKMCIREGFKGWQSSDMDFDNFKKLIPYLKDVERVVLEGWGESLLHKNLLEIIRLTKRQGPEVGFVTSGRGLNKEYISELIDAGLDFIGFSLSGSTQVTHDSIRIGSDFQRLIKNIKTFNELKRVKKLKRPRLHIVYLMIRNNIFEVPSLIGLVKDIGIRDVILINLIHITNEWQEEQRIFGCIPLTHPSSRWGEGEGKRYEDILKETETKAKELNINLKRPSLLQTEVYVCEEDPLRNLYISTDGEVAPCVYLYPPVTSPFKRVFCGREYKIERLSFGNIFKEPFHNIWDRREYVDFRNRFILRKKSSEGISLFLRDIKRLRGAGGETLPDPPGYCRTCHKILGV